MEELKIKTTKREVLGKQVKQLRARGTTPVHLYGPGTPSRALQADTPTLEKLLSHASTSHLVDLTVDRARSPVRVLVREVQRDPLSDKLLHVDFFQVSMTEETTVEMPLTLVGEPGAKHLMVEQMLHQLSIKCLPGDIPPSMEVDISSLAEPGQAILVKDISFGPGVSVQHDPEDIIVRVEAPTVVVEEVEKAAAEEAVAAPAAAGKAPAGEARAAEGKSREGSRD